MLSAETDRSTALELEAIAWIYTEIEQILTQTQKTLKSRLRVLTGERKSSEEGDKSALKELASRLNQATKAFYLVDGNGVGKMLEGIFAAVSHIAVMPGTLSEENVNKINGACFALLDYLQQLLRAKRVSPIALFPQYAQAMAVASREALPADLWNYKQQWVDVELPEKKYNDEERDDAHARLGNCMLRLLRGDLEAAADFKIVSYELASTTDDAQGKQFWILVTAFFDGIAAGLIPLDVYTKRVASQVLQAYKLYTDGKLEISEKFSKNVLFFCLNLKEEPQESNAPVLSVVYQAYQGEQTEWVNYIDKQYGRIDPSLIAVIQKRISTAKAAWSSYSSGEPIQPQNVITAVANACEMLKQVAPESARFSDTLLATVTGLAKANKTPAPDVALEVATSILYLEAIFSSLDLSTQELQERFDRLTERLTLLAKTGKPLPLDGWIEDLYRTVQDDATMESVIGELHAMLNKVEHEVDSYLRKNEDAHILSRAIDGMGEMHGILSVLGLDEAAQGIAAMRRQVQWLFDHDGKDDGKVAGERIHLINSLSNSLGAFGFLVNMLAHQPLITRELFFFDEETQELTLLMGRDKTEERIDLDIQQEENIEAVEEVVEVQTEEQEPVFTAADAEIDEEVSIEIAPTEVIEDYEEYEEAPTIQANSEEIESSLDMAEDDFFGDDLRDIFLEEAHEVIELAQTDWNTLKINTTDRDALTSVRRGFHTLKGSARMVGLMDFGEAAWAAEQCLNDWLTVNAPVSAAVLDYASWALKKLQVWVEDLQAGRDPSLAVADFEDAARFAIPTEDDYGSIDSRQTVEGAAESEFHDDGIVDSSTDDAATMQLGAVEEAQKIGFDFSGIDLSLDPNTVESVEDEGFELDIVEDTVSDVDIEEQVQDEQSTVEAIADGETMAEETFAELELSDEETMLLSVNTQGEVEDKDETISLDDDIELVTDDAQTVSTTDGDMEIEDIAEEANEGAVSVFMPTAILADDEKAKKAAAAVEDETISIELDEDATPVNVQEDTSDYVQFGALRIDKSLYSIYIEEAQERVESLKHSLLKWHAAGAYADLEDAQISSHGIAGSSYTVGLNELAAFSKALEKSIEYYCGTLDSDNIPSDRSHTLLFWAAAEEIHRILERLLQGQLEAPSQTISKNLSNFINLEFEHVLNAVAAEEAAMKVKDGLAADISEGVSFVSTLDSIYPDDLTPYGQFVLDDSAVVRLAAADRKAVMSDMYALFEEEGQDLLESISEELRNWSTNPADSSYIAAALRALHTLKGSARLTGAMRLGHLVHEFETALEKVEAQESITSQEVQNILTQVDALNSEMELLNIAAEEYRQGRFTIEEIEALPIDNIVLAEEPIPANDEEEYEPAIEEAQAATEDDATVVETGAEAEPVVTTIEELEQEAEPEFKPELEPVSYTQSQFVNSELQTIEHEVEAEREIDADLFTLFKEEAADLLEQVGKDLRQLPTEQNTAKESMLRNLHTLKGSARLTGAMHLGKQAHDLETLLNTLTDNSDNNQAITAEIENGYTQMEVEFERLTEEAKAEHLRRSEKGQPLMALDPVDRAVIGSKVFLSFAQEARKQINGIAEKLDQWQSQADSGIALIEVLQALNVLDDNIRLAGLNRLGRITQKLDYALRSLIGMTATNKQVKEIVGLYTNARFELDLLDAAAKEVHIDDEIAAEQIAEELHETGEDTEEVETSLVTQEEKKTTAIVSTATPRKIQPTAARQVKSRTSSQMIRVNAGLIDDLVTKSGEVSMIRGQLAGEARQLKEMLLNELSLNLERLRAQARDIEMQAETQMTSRMDAAKAEGHEFDPLEFDRYTRIQELTRMIAESVNDVGTVQKALMQTTTAIEDGLAAQSRSARDMQHVLLRARMVKFSSVAERFHRVVRLAATECEKEAKLTIIGGEIEIDRAVLDYVVPAFEHMLRNSVVHGIETPEQRRKLDKKPEGEIKLVLSQEGNDVSISLVDDGAGLDLDKIRERALEIGLIEADSQISDYDLAQMIYKSGLTTAEHVTELAGRGVGLDMAYAEIAGQGGRTEVVTTANEGTEFKIRLPLTTAVTQIALVDVCGKTFGIPVNLIESIQRFSSTDIMDAIKHGVMKYEGEELPAYWLGGLLEMKMDKTSIRNHRLQWLVLNASGQRIVVAVDQVIGSQEVVIKNVGPQFAHLTGFAGLTVLAGGRTVLIYNPLALVRVFTDYGQLSEILTYEDDISDSIFQQSVYTQFESSTYIPPIIPRTKKVMVVDDSLTVRRITERFLERHGFEVTLAKDGQDALNQLNNELPALILSDIEMPRMDGFEFVRQLREKSDTSDLPVIMITSRIAQKHHDYATELGVKHYLGKPYDEEELLRLVKKYVAEAPDPDTVH